LASVWCSRAARALAVALLCTFAAASARATVYASRAEALAAAFPDADRIEEQSYVLTEAQAKSISELAGVELARKIWTVHAAWKGTERLGFAILDVHTVRTLPEALLVVLTPEGAVRSLRILAFHEPSEFQPPERWLEQMDGKRLGPELHLKREIHVLAGATLSSQAVTRSVRTALALYQVLLVDEHAAE
jgi:hypothetical protein